MQIFFANKKTLKYEKDISGDAPIRRYSFDVWANNTNNKPDNITYNTHNHTNVNLTDKYAANKHSTGVNPANDHSAYEYTAHVNFAHEYAAYVNHTNDNKPGEWYDNQWHHEQYQYNN